MAFNKGSNPDEKPEKTETALDDIDEDDDEEEQSSPSWLASYSDMMTDLMAIFVILFAFAMITTSHENKVIKEQLHQAEAQTAVSAVSAEESGVPEISRPSDELDEVYEKIRKKIAEGGYSESILMEKQDSYINFKFKDNLLFYPDSATMRESSSGILRYMGTLLLSVDSEIDSIEISGFTADAGAVSSGNYFSWELSSDRAISVLKFFSADCKLPQSKMFISGYSHYKPVAGNDTEQDRSLNRRVEVKIVRANSAAAAGASSGR